MVKHQTRFEVEEIRDKKVRQGRVEYLVKWKNYPETQNTWEPRKHLKACHTLIHEFEETRKEKSRTDLVSMQLEELLEKSDDYWEKRKEAEPESAPAQSAKEPVKLPIAARMEEKPSEPPVVKKTRTSRGKRVAADPVFKIQKTEVALHLETWFVIESPQKGEVLGCYRDESGEVLVELATEEYGKTLVLLEDAVETEAKGLVRYLIERLLKEMS